LGTKETCNNLQLQLFGTGTQFEKVLSPTCKLTKEGWQRQ